MNKKKRKKGFTLVELLAVIVVLAIILIIAVPQIMSTIEESRNGAFASSAKLIASSAETLKLTNDTLGIEKTINCADVAEYNSEDYESCDIEFDDEGKAVITLVGKGKFAGKYVCNGTRTNAVVTEEECSLSDENGITAASYIESLLANEAALKNGLQEIIIDPSISTSTSVQNLTGEINAGIRYVGASDAVKNKVYYNCEETDAAGVSYGEDTYDYASLCETWRIIGVFDVEDGSGNTEKRVKIINTESTFNVSWDSAAYVNSEWGINQWGPSTYVTNGSAYAGADLMQLLNGYYIGKEGSECKYNNTSGINSFILTCDTENTPLSSLNMKPLTSNAKGMIGNAVWYTYAANTNTAEAAYVQEKGISTQYTGKSECYGGNYCNDTVNRTTSWTGLVGLMSVSDIGFANGWLYNPSGTLLNPWSITPYTDYTYASRVWNSESSSAGNAYSSYPSGVWPAVYLDSNVQIIGGDGLDTPYKLKA